MLSFKYGFSQVQLVGLDEESSEFICRNTFDHPYPTTKLMWIPDTKGVYPDLLATSGDYLRVWRVSKSPQEKMSQAWVVLCSDLCFTQDKIFFTAIMWLYEDCKRSRIIMAIAVLISLFKMELVAVFSRALGCKAERKEPGINS